MIETENSSLVSSPEHPSYRADNNADTSARSNNMDMQINSGCPSSLSPTKFVSASAPIDLVTPEDHQLTGQSSSHKAVVQTDLHKLADVALNESAIIPSIEQSESVFNPQDSNNDTVANHIPLEDYCCLLSSSSSLDESALSMPMSLNFEFGNDR